MKYCIVFIIFFIALLNPKMVLGQEDKPSPVQFHGSNILTGQYSNMQGIGQEIPPSFFRNDLKMTLSVYDIPVSASFFITSEQRDYRQSINNFRIYFDARELLKNKGLASTEDIITSAALFNLKNLEKAKDGLEKSNELLNVDVLNNLSNLEILQQGYEKAKKELENAKLNKGTEEVEQAKARLEEAKDKLDKVQDKYEKAKAKLDEVQARIEDTMARLEQAKAKVEEVKSLTFDTGAAKKKAEALAKKSAMSGMTRFLANFTTLEIGKCRPNYSELTLRGISLSGVNIEFNPGPFYAAFSTGKTKRPIKPSEITKPTYEQKILFGKLGLGKKQGTHFYFTYMQVEDQQNSLPIVADSFYVKPQANILVGTEARISLFDNKFSLEGEAAVSVFTRDTESPKLDFEGSEIPPWLINTVEPRLSSSADYAYAVKSDLTLATTKISGSVRMVGAGYNTLGNPNLVNDRMSYDARINQSLAKKQISLSIYFKENKDNLIEWKKATSTTTAYGITAGLVFKKLPYLQVAYTPFFQKNNSDSLKLDNTVQVFNLSTGYSFPIGKVNSSSSFNFFYQDSETAIDTMLSGSKNQTYTFNESLSFRFPLSLSGGISWSTSEFADQQRDILTLIFSATHKAFKKWRNSVGVKYSNQIDEQKMIGIFWSSRISIGKFFDFDMRVEENMFRNNLNENSNFDELIAQGTLVFKW